MLFASLSTGSLLLRVDIAGPLVHAKFRLRCPIGVFFCGVQGLDLGSGLLNVQPGVIEAPAIWEFPKKGDPNIVP